MTILTQECERILIAFPFAGTCSSCQRAARWWPALKMWSHTYYYDEVECVATQDRHFVEIEQF